MTLEQTTFIAADKALNDVIQQIGDDQWGLPIPEWFSVGRTQDNMTLRKIVNYHAYDEIWVPETLAGKTIEEVGDKYDGDLIGDDPKAAYAALVEKAEAAVEAIDDLDRKVHLTYGEWPIRDYLLHIITFRGFRAHDIARLIGASTKLPDEVVQGMWDLLRPHAEEYRQIGIFKPAIEVPEDAPLQTKMLAMAGREDA